MCRCKELRSRQALKQAFQICVAAFPNTIGLVFLSDKGQQGGIDCVAADYDTRPIRHDKSNEISGRNCWLLAPIRMNATRMDQRHCICKITFNSSAAAWGRPDFFTPLVEFGADSKLVNSKGWTVADYSYSQKIAELVQSKLFAKH